MKKLFGYWLFFFFFLYVRRMKPLSFKHGFCPFLQISQRMSFLVFARFWRRYVFSEFIGVSPFQPGAACVHRLRSLAAGNCLFAHSENHTFLIPLAYTFLGFCLLKILLIFLFGV
jgi:hypothetical protein